MVDFVKQAREMVNPRREYMRGREDKRVERMWQSIETVPKDGTVVDLWVKDTSEENSFRRGSQKSYRIPDCKWEIDVLSKGPNDPDDEGCWSVRWMEIDSWNHDGLNPEETPTHWILPPDAPVSN